VFAQMAVRGGQLGFHKNYVYLYCFFYLLYDQIRMCGLPLNAVFSKWPPRQINCPPLAYGICLGD